MVSFLTDRLTPAEVRAMVVPITTADIPNGDVTRRAVATSNTDSTVTALSDTMANAPSASVQLSTTLEEVDGRGVFVFMSAQLSTGGATGNSIVNWWVTRQAPGGTETVLRGGTLTLPSVYQATISATAYVTAADAVNGQTTYRLRTTRRTNSAAPSFVAADRGLIILQPRV